MKNIGKPCAGKPHARFDEGGQARACSLLYPKLPANRSAFEAALSEERSRLVKARHDLSSAEQVKTKLTEVLPHYRKQDNAFEKLARDGYAGTIMASDKKRERIEKEQELNPALQPFRIISVFLAYKPS